jgi:hypothetical protein
MTTALFTCELCTRVTRERRHFCPHTRLCGLEDCVQCDAWRAQHSARPPAATPAEEPMSYADLPPPESPVPVVTSLRSLMASPLVAQSSSISLGAIAYLSVHPQGFFIPTAFKIVSPHSFLRSDCMVLDVRIGKNSMFCSSSPTVIENLAFVNHRDLFTVVQPHQEIGVIVQNVGDVPAVCAFEWRGVELVVPSDPNDRARFLSGLR